MKSKNFNPVIIVVIIVVLGSLAAFLLIGFLNMDKPASERDAEGEASNISIEQGDKELQEYPILSYLPIKNAIYTIGYQYEDDGEPTILIDTVEWYFEAALKKLESLGTPERPASSYRIKVVSPELGEEESILLQKFLSHQL